MKHHQFTRRSPSRRSLPPALAAAGAIVDEWWPEFDRQASRRVDLLIRADDMASTSARSANR